MHHGTPPSAPTLALALGLLTSGCYENGGRDAAETDGTEVPTSTSSADTDGPLGTSTGGGTSGPEGMTNASADDTTGAEDDTGAGSDEVDLNALVAALCDWDFECCSDGEIDYRLGPFTADAADCTARFVEQLESNDNDAVSPRGDLLSVLGYSIDLSRSDPNAKSVAACVEQQKRRTCNALLDEESFCEPSADPAGDPCRMDNLFTGTLVAGEPCSAGLAAIGDVECQPGTTCELVDDDDWVCVDKGLLDEFCEADSTCDGGLFCDLQTGRCAEKSDLGGPCSFEDATEPDAGTEVQPCREGLSCDPTTNECVAFCSEGFDCAADESCPQGQSCIPLDIGDNTYTYCGPRGDTNGDRCDTDRDCADSFHCDGSACASDIAVDDACTASEQCEEGLYCDGVCTVVRNSMELCTADFECNPSTTIGCITSEDGRRCRTAELLPGDECEPGERDGGTWCATGLCEDLASDGIAGPTCQIGAAVGAACDEDPATLGVPSCAVTSYCDEGTCRPKAESGQDCSDDQALQCLNGNCEEIWSGEFCTDDPPTIEASAATCDGV